MRKRIISTIAGLLLSGVAYAGTLTQGQVDADRFALETVLGRTTITTPGTPHPDATICTPARSGGVECSTHTEQHDANGVTFQSPEGRMAYEVRNAPRLPTLDGGLEYHVAGTRLNLTSDLVASGAEHRIDVMIYSGFQDVTLSNVSTTSPRDTSRQDVTLAEVLYNDHAHQYDDLDWVLFDNIKDVLSARVCDDISAGTGPCAPHVNIAFLRKPAVGEYRAYLSCAGGYDCGVAVVDFTTTLSGGLLTTGWMTAQTGDPDWTFSKELDLSMHEAVNYPTYWTVPFSIIIQDGSQVLDTETPWEIFYENESKRDPSSG